MSGIFRYSPPLVLVGGDGRWTVTGEILSCGLCESCPLRPPYFSSSPQTSKSTKCGIAATYVMASLFISIGGPSPRYAERRMEMHSLMHFPSRESLENRLVAVTNIDFQISYFTSVLASSVRISLRNPKFRITQFQMYRRHWQARQRSGNWQVKIILQCK